MVVIRTRASKYPHFRPEKTQQNQCRRWGELTRIKMFLAFAPLSGRCRLVCKQVGKKEMRNVLAIMATVLTLVGASSAEARRYEGRSDSYKSSEAREAARERRAQRAERTYKSKRAYRSNASRKAAYRTTK